MESASSVFDISYAANPVSKSDIISLIKGKQFYYTAKNTSPKQRKTVNYNSLSKVGYFAICIKIVTTDNLELNLAPTALAMSAMQSIAILRIYAS